MALQLLRLVASQIKVGAPLPFGVRDEHGKLLLARGQMIGADSQLELLLARGIYADKEEIEALAQRAAPAAEARRLTLFDLWEHAIWRLEKLLASLEEPDFPARCDAFAVQLMELVQRDTDIAIYLSVRQDERRLNLYGLTHSLHCALVCQLMGARLAWPDDRVRMLVKAALTMNLSITELQGRLVVHGRLSDAQRAQIRSHPELAVERLRAAGVVDERWLRTVLEHHERAGAGGYPFGLQAVSEDAEVLRMADVFMAKISPRAERPALSIQEAARQMFAEAAGNPAAAAVIKEYGIYPPGNIVQLVSGELAIVIRRGATAHTPIAAAITDKSGIPTVNTARRDTAQAAYAIKALGNAKDVKELVQRVPPERLYGLIT
jgi:HD-GYP domain-containing protein (c-di-GMP phosphodiesterase class II)